MGPLPHRGRHQCQMPQLHTHLTPPHTRYRPGVSSSSPSLFSPELWEDFDPLRELHLSHNLGFLVLESHRESLGTSVGPWERSLDGGEDGGGRVNGRGTQSGEEKKVP
jgi:hypothetical protein